MRLFAAGISDSEVWDGYVSAAGSFYHRFAWLAINRKSFGHQSAYLAAEQDGRIVGVFPIVQVKSLLFGNIACSLPFVNYGGPCGENEEIVRALIAEGARVAEKWGVEYLEIRTRHHLGDGFPTAEHKVSMTVELHSDPDVLWKGFKTGHRQDIRRAYKNGFEARWGSDLLDDFYQVLLESWRELGTPIYSKQYLKAIVDAFGDSIRICVVYKGTEPAAAAFDGLHRDTVEGMWLGMRASFRKELVGYVLYWELLKNACELGFKRFHLGRSTVQSGGEIFKKKWNASTTQLYWQYILRTRREIPQLNVNNSKYRLAIGAWQRLPLGVTRLVGPLIARSIP
jgi:FemAB-related protein (PEP-CTERM system-associated)